MTQPRSRTNTTSASNVFRFSVGFLLSSALSIQVWAAELDALRDRLGALTPKVQIKRMLGPDLLFLGYSLADAAAMDVPANTIHLNSSHEFEITLYFEQRTLQSNSYQILLQASDLLYDERSGLETSRQNRDVTLLRRRLPVDLARGTLLSQAGHAGGILTLNLRVTVPRYLLARGETECKFVAIFPDGSVSNSQHLEFFTLDPPAGVGDSTGDRISATPNPANLLGNASFEDDPRTNTRGNWTLWNRRGVMQFLDESESVHGDRALRFDFFGGTNVHMYSKHQEVATKPDTEYELSWYVKSAGITSSRGPRVIVWDADKGWEHFADAGEQVVGDTPWTRKQLRFRTPKDTENVRVIIERYATDDASAIPNPDELVGGSAWFDLIELVEQGH